MFLRECGAFLGAKGGRLYGAVVSGGHGGGFDWCVCSVRRWEGVYPSEEQGLIRPSRVPPSQSELIVLYYSSYTENKHLCGTLLTNWTRLFGTEYFCRRVLVYFDEEQNAPLLSSYVFPLITTHISSQEKAE